MLPANLESELLRRGEMTVLFGRPGQGKTSLALHLAMKAAGRGETALVFSMKTPSARLMKRLVCLEARVPLAAAMSDQLEPADRKKAAAALKRLSKSPLFVDDSTASVSQIVRLGHRAADNAASKRRRLGLIVIDYLELLSELVSEGPENEPAAVTRALKALARELDVPILAMSLSKRRGDPLGVLERDIFRVVLTLHRRDRAPKRIRLRFDRTTGELTKP